jgi:hypothetical protein
MGVVGYHMTGGNNIVHTDGWRAYRKVDWAATGSERVEHVHLNARTFEHCNHIEGFWGEIKYQMRHIYNQTGADLSLEAFMWEACWRRTLSRHRNAGDKTRYRKHILKTYSRAYDRVL